MKERLHLLVESMTDEQAESTLGLLGEELIDTAGNSDVRPIPAWVGAYRGSGDALARPVEMPTQRADVAFEHIDGQVAGAFDRRDPRLTHADPFRQLSLRQPGLFPQCRQAHCQSN